MNTRINILKRIAEGHVNRRDIGMAGGELLQGLRDDGLVSQHFGGQLTITDKGLLQLEVNMDRVYVLQHSGYGSPLMHLMADPGGYTTCLTKAMHFTEEQAKSQADACAEYTAWKLSTLQAVAEPMVDLQLLLEKGA